MYVMFQCICYVLLLLRDLKNMNYYYYYYEYQDNLYEFDINEFDISLSF